MNLDWSHFSLRDVQEVTRFFNKACNYNHPDLASRPRGRDREDTHQGKLIDPQRCPECGKVNARKAVEPLSGVPEEKVFSADGEEMVRILPEARYRVHYQDCNHTVDVSGQQMLAMVQET